MNFSQLDASGPGGAGLLHAVEGLLSTVFIPSLRRLEKGWGSLGESQQGLQTKQDFLNQLDSFVAVLVGKGFLFSSVLLYFFVAILA